MLFASPSLAFVLTFVLTGGPPAPAVAQPAPPTGLTFPHEERGACPFECCAYGRWVAAGPVTVRGARAAEAPPAFRVAAGESVEARSGTVVTTRPGRVRALARVTLDGVSIERGEEVPVLRHAGDGTLVLWARGRAVRSPADAGGPAWRVLAEPRTVWWVEIRNARGEVGWSEQTDRFDVPARCK